MRFGIVEVPEERVPTWIRDRITYRRLVGVGVAWLVLLFVVPVVVLLFESLNLEGGEGIFVNYRNALSGVWLMTLARTFYYALLTTFACLVLGYAFAYYVAFRTRRRIVFLALVALPLWVAIIIRYFGVALFFLPTGPFVGVFGSDFGILFNTPGVIVGLTSALLPFAILPIYNSLRSIDEEMIHASRVLGAGQLRTVYEVIWPMSLSGVVAATLFVYILAAGSFLAPAILGGSGNFMMANVIEQTFGYAMGLGSALAVVFTVSLLVLIAAFNRFVNISEVLGDL